MTEDQYISPAPTAAPKVLKGEGNVYVRLEQQDSMCTTKFSQIGEYLCVQINVDIYTI